MAKDNEVFKEFRRLSRILAVYNRENFQVIDRKARWKNASIAFIFTVLLISLGLLFVSAIWHCFDCGFAISEIAFAIPTSLCILQILSTYFSMAINNRKIAQTVACLQKVITERKFLPADGLGLLILFFMCFVLFLR